MSIKDGKDLEKSFTESILAGIEKSENPLEFLGEMKFRIEKMLRNLTDNEDLIERDKLLLCCEVQLKVVNLFIEKEEKK